MSAIRSVGQSVSTLWGQGRGRILVVIASGWGLLVGTRMAYPVLLPYLRDTYELSLSVAGLLVTILWLGSALGQLPGGILADRYSERRLMAAGLLIVAIAVSIVVLTSTAAVVFLGTGLVGIGLSLYPIARITVLTELYPDSIGSALGVTMASGDIGQTVLPPAAGVLAAAVAWELGLGVVIPLFLLVAGFIWLVVPTATNDDETGMSLTEAKAGLMGLDTGTMTLVTVVLFVYILIWQSFTGFYPTYLAEIKDLSPSVAGTVFALFFGIGVVVKPVSGAAYDRIGMRGSLLAVLIGPIVGLGALPFVKGFWPLVGLTILVSTMLGSGAITQSYLADTLPEAIRGTGLGIIRTIAASLGAGGPVLFGILADNGLFDEGYLILAVLMVLLVVLTTQLPASR